MRYVWLVLMSIFCLCQTNVLWAHGGEPLSRTVLENGDSWLLKTNFGLIRGDDPTRFICEESFLGGDDFFVLPLKKDQWVMATASHIVRTEDGCDFTFGMTLNELPKALESSPDGKFVAMVTNDDTLNANVWKSQDGGKSFDSVAVMTDVFWTGARFVDAKTLFMSGYVNVGDDRGQARFVSINFNTGVVEQMPTRGSLKYPYIMASGDNMVAGIASDEDSGKLVLFYDQPAQIGQFLEPLVVWPTQIELTRDGRQIWLAQNGQATGARYGQRNENGEVVWETILEGSQLLCVTQREGVLFVCTDRDEHDADVISLNGEGVIEPKVRFKSLVGVRKDCSASSQVAKTCPLIWKEIAKQLRIEIPDMGTMDMTMDMVVDVDLGPSHKKPTTQPDEGCSLVGQNAPRHPLSKLLWIGMFLFVGVFRRRLVV